ncbi:MAG: lysophospholipid acyltransferase family protein [Candidatus Omnitrophica bacterium]|nr:lysophospholipid acyltransferase family protein [Candidatus Omnitrophota bacterium]
MFYLYKIAQFLLLNLPLKVGYAIATFIANAYFLFSKKDKNALIANIKVVLNNPSKDEFARHCARMCFINFGKYLVDFLRFKKIDQGYIHSNVAIEGLENVKEALRHKKGAIMLSSHIGNWELAGAVFSLSMGFPHIDFPLYAIALDHVDKKVNDFFIKQRASKGVQTIPIGVKLKQCFQVLRKNKALAILGDRDFSEKGEKIEFLGKETLLPKGPAVFFVRTGAPILPVFMLREKSDKFRFVIESPINHALTGNEERDKREIIKSYVSVIERYIKKYPDQWYVFRNVWNET